ncbi:hypothetical protein BDP27DRAFT_1370039 [Rhodocollybia butyracea]|uniref:Uncharacterized protein n=1 Tax=Rhodocollybia butyracea TaxID=206335 RepID=A0A9P5P8R2_9AGAR|nr:hypothetical protein BDP27DRAFT_1370039 [Rhodocollybia butyracea]
MSYVSLPAGIYYIYTDIGKKTMVTYPTSSGNPVRTGAFDSANFWQVAGDGVITGFPKGQQALELAATHTTSLDKDPVIGGNTGTKWIFWQFTKQQQGGWVGNVMANDNTNNLWVYDSTAVNNVLIMNPRFQGNTIGSTNTFYFDPAPASVITQ